MARCLMYGYISDCFVVSLINEIKTVEKNAVYKFVSLRNDGSRGK